MTNHSLLSVSETLRFAERELIGVSDEPRRDAEVLLSAVLDCDRSYFFAYGERHLDDDSRDIFLHYLKRRKEGEPVAYIIGKREFWSLLLSVNDCTLIPRPDTEVLVEAALQYCLKPQARVIDLGTGTGAIALALASERLEWMIEAVDVSADAVALAKINAQHLKLTNVRVYSSDWFSEVDKADPVLGNCFDMVIGNPPYIAAADPHLSVGDVRFEPVSALVADNDGYADLFFIADEARKYLCRDGLLLLEHGYDQANLMREFLCDLGYQSVKTISDYNGNERVVFARWPGRS